jgi:hydroxymethylpyrimidine/phosphomethylpyrimidine kinase
MKRVLTIAGTDPSGGAGLQADLKVFSDMSVKGYSVVTALTAQTSTRVMAVTAVSSVFVAKELDAVMAECGKASLDAIKIGMLSKAAIVGVVISFLKKHPEVSVVLDPVFHSTSGMALLDKRGIERVRALLPLSTVVTPNLEEASVLCSRPVRTVKDMKEAAQRIGAMGASNVVIKGGHLKKSAVDILYDGKGFHYFEGKRVSSEKEKFHGTGCRFSSAIAANLAKGKSVKKSVEEAKKYVLKKLI